MECLRLAAHGSRQDHGQSGTTTSLRAPASYLWRLFLDGADLIPPALPQGFRRTTFSRAVRWFTSLPCASSVVSVYAPLTRTTFLCRPIFQPTISSSQTNTRALPSVKRRRLTA